MITYYFKPSNMALYTAHDIEHFRWWWSDFCYLGVFPGPNEARAYARSVLHVTLYV